MCGKVRYLSRKHARQSRRLPRHSCHLSAYVCGECGFWHLGHTSAGVIAGQVSRRHAYGVAR